ncbi:cytochrome oxidase assembly protein ShyY1 [Rheinheimera pacifica]|uniref:SURF1 family protein n=1 Tax=Rheinheimera pacifica TaxID=173990 RepID=UPI002168C789|nr:SURF1 family protein [Rheinheimera pacifica]MCS4308390.1 cytochrome oxidase assembly protein ShyY1 [Rheinheimera pacifica]
MRVKLANQIFALNTLWVILTLTAFAILINLSWWQLSRAAEKTGQLARLAQLQADGAVTPAQLTQLAAADIDGVPLKGQANWLAPYIWLLDNQIVNGRVGYDVIVPVQAAGMARPLLVNLGWLAGADSRETLPQFDMASEVELDGLLRTKVDGLMLLGQNAEDHGQWPMRIQQIDYAELAQQSGLELYPAVLYQQQASNFIPHYQPVVLSPEKHRGYALQWFLLAVAVVGVALAASHQGKAKYE